MYNFTHDDQAKAQCEDWGLWYAPILQLVFYTVHDVITDVMLINTNKTEASYLFYANWTL